MTSSEWRNAEKTQKLDTASPLSGPHCLQTLLLQLLAEPLLHCVCDSCFLYCFHYQFSAVAHVLRPFVAFDSQQRNNTHHPSSCFFLHTVVFHAVCRYEVDAALGLVCFLVTFLHFYLAMKLEASACLWM